MYVLVVIYRPPHPPPPPKVWKVVILKKSGGTVKKNKQASNYTKHIKFDENIDNTVCQPNISIVFGQAPGDVIESYFLRYIVCYERQPVGLAEVIFASEASLGGPGGRALQMCKNRVK